MRLARNADTSQMDWYERTQQGATLAPLRWFTLAQATVGPHAQGLAADDGSRLVTAGKAFENESTYAQIADDLRATGFSSLIYVAFETAGRHRLRTFALRDFVPVGYLERYLAAGLEFGDPRLTAVEHSGLPCVWDVARLRQDSCATPALAALTDLLVQYRLASGVTFGMALPSVGLRVLICAASGQSGSAWIDDRMVSQALMTGLNVHRAVQPLVEQMAASVRDPDLDPEQASVLDQLVLGLSAREISERLSLSVHQVNHHVRVLQRKFNVVNRMQLAYVAGRRERLMTTQAPTPD